MMNWVEKIIKDFTTFYQMAYSALLSAEETRKREWFHDSILYNVFNTAILVENKQVESNNTNNLIHLQYYLYKIVPVI